jgi:S-adenosylmethionine/arginine decarboxylase-like enzyme
MDNKLLVHKHLIVRAEVYRPPMDEEVLKSWLEEFISEIGMKVMMGPYVKYSNMIGNRGITGAAIIETSHIVMHVWDEVHPALMQFDVYSCGEFEPETICKKIEKDFTVHKIEYKFLDREHDLQDVKQSSSINYIQNPIVKNFQNKEIEKKNNALLRSRKEVEINGNGTSGYTIKEGIHKGVVLGHITREKQVIEN